MAHKLDLQDTCTKPIKLISVLTKYYSNCMVILAYQLPKAIIKVFVLNFINCQTEELFSGATIVLSLLNMENHQY